MPHEVIMPALGMAQETGQILAWHKKPGEAVAEGDVLFEVETDKAAMEVEAPKPGYLTNVTAEAGSDVPVGQVIALISNTPGGVESEQAPQEAGDMPAASGNPAEIDGHQVIMPTLGMAQDTGLLVGWQKQPGEAVTADDILFEVETDKSTVEVSAGHDGYVAALLAEAGEEVPVGQTIAVISAEKPDNPIERSARSGAVPSRSDPPPAAEPAVPAKSASLAPARPLPGGQVQAGGKILASPKARRLALEQGLDLKRLVDAGHEQPFHARDLDALKALPAPTISTAPLAATQHLTAEIAEDGFADFAAWAADAVGLKDAGALLAGLAAASLCQLPAVVTLDGSGGGQAYTVSSARLGQVARAEADTRVDLRVRDLRFSRISTVQLGAEDCPMISIVRAGQGLRLTLECAGDQFTAAEAVTLLSNFAGRMEQPLRHLL
ncbi:biotin/lipoyl-containing protein [Roseibium salinum]|uniref:Lipoyl-binding domain-containing protein n=1 Tax=Roseibium salinum TaxID=1604349 RepID=A0ABT3QVZ4_9HYPH|nr:biotin/lipoyl-containing protein [Roseibium sp. DSM 29163]MCX2721028.1 hypothetical protein [Roseibium sp. DSM 29163]MDN3722486.1 biotin/lipoyl-containing protein [Roseibium salinum]